ncbi:MAG TPA: glycine cleavage T C-terminal barrel domain-containing protein [Bryobacteraceae bacterium]|nr:glycine cleavage T C-terminal barrel domain-containing protein [Bryobacteraceae bacterium]
MSSSSYDALRDRAAWIDLTGRGKLRATGEDRARLLHSMTTNDIQALVPGEGCYAFFLTAQGRILGDANIFCMTDYLLIDTEPEIKQRIYEHLDKYIIADDVMLHDFTKDYASINVEGPGTEEVLKSLHIPVAHAACSIAEWSHCEVAHISYTGQVGYSFFVPCEHKADLVAKLAAAGIPEADLSTAEVVRIENGKPKYGVDITETTLPQETQLMHAVHSSKGCYLGQEIVERIRSQGRVNKVIAPMEIDGTVPPTAGTKVETAGKDVGVVTSAVFSAARGKVVALGIIRAEAIGQPLTIAGAGAIAGRAGK